MPVFPIKRTPTQLALVLTFAAAIGWSTGCDSSSSPASSSCQTGDLRCVCYANNTCDPGLTCVSDTCISSTTDGTGGATSKPDPGGQGGQSSGDGGASASVGAGGASTVVGAGGASTIVGAGGAISVGEGGSSTVATGGTVAVAAGGASAVNNSPIIDAFATCDANIENNGGRSGKWYYFADSDYNATHSYGDPGTQWADHGCAAWMILGCTGTACTYAGLGLQLSNGNPYDLSAYQGISVAFEGKDNVYFVVKTSDGGYFGTWLTGTTGNQTRNANFSSLVAMANSAVSSLNTSLITEIQFTVGKTLASGAGFGLAIHSVSLR